MTAKAETICVYFDGSCPLCRSEIAHYRRQDRNGRISFVDVARSDVELGDDLTRAQAMARLHLRFSDGAMTSGARAFVAIWQVLPGWRWAARVARIPGVIHVLELCYRAFLPVRHWISKLFGNLTKRVKQS